MHLQSLSGTGVQERAGEERFNEQENVVADNAGFFVDSGKFLGRAGARP
jgi:hypothetical protein